MTPPDALATAIDPDVAATAEERAPSRRGDTRRRIAKYLAIFRVSLSERMTYRGDFLIATILRFLPMLTTILLWQAIYVGAGREHSDLEGFRFKDMIAYLL